MNRNNRESKSLPIEPLIADLEHVSNQLNLSTLTPVQRQKLTNILRALLIKIESSSGTAEDLTSPTKVYKAYYSKLEALYYTFKTDGWVSKELFNFIEELGNYTNQIVQDVEFLNSTGNFRLVVTSKLDTIANNSRYLSQDATELSHKRIASRGSLPAYEAKVSIKMYTLLLTIGQLIEALEENI